MLGGPHLALLSVAEGSAFSNRAKCGKLQNVAKRAQQHANKAQLKPFIAFIVRFQPVFYSFSDAPPAHNFARLESIR
jgi:hypothetical protein